MSKRIVVLGGGITGLTIAKLLSNDFDVTILEKENGRGLCKTQSYDGIPIDVFGGHIFYTQFDDVKKFIFNILPEKGWNKSTRNAKIWIENEIIEYPFEKSKCCKKILSKDFRTKDIKKSNNLKNYLENRFGTINCNKYFIPYNEKIWQYPLEKIGINWICPTKIPTGSGPMMKLDFYYPKTGGIQSVVDKIYDGKIIKHATIHNIWNYKSEIVVTHHSPSYGAQIKCDALVSTIPLNDLLFPVGRNIGFDDYSTKKMLNLPYHGTEILVCKSNFFKKHPEISWIYFPEKDIPFHRLANISLAQHTEHDLILIECPHGTNLEKVKLLEYSFEIIDKFSHDMTYPIEPIDDYERKNAIITNLEKRNIYSIGRWGRHEYWNIDFCIKDAIETVKKIKDKDGN